MWKPLIEVYPDNIRDGDRVDVYDYNPLLQSFGYEIVVQVDEDGYQGDSRLLFKREDGQYGYLNFGWGSCSGCDSLQACDTVKDVEDLRQSLHDDIRWGTSAELLEFFRTHDWEGDYSWSSTEMKQFVEQAIAKLESIATE